MALPSNHIGSWTNRITKLLENDPDFFSFILSPTKQPNSKHIFCKKRRWIPFVPKKLREFEIIHFRVSDFIQAFKKIHQQHSNIEVLVVDDLLLLEAFALLKNENFAFKLIFSFHGHSFHLPGSWGRNVDQVLFLTKSGYLDTFKQNEEFSPKITIVGNGVDSRLFFPLTKYEKEKRRSELGLLPNSKILIWMSNNRPKKGIHIFLELVKVLLQKYGDLEILIIGAEVVVDQFPGRVHSIGKIPNSELPKYLQIGDFYAFTSLWQEGFGLSLAEAAKCGNIIIASKVGGVPDVIEEVPSAILVTLPNSIEAWEKAFDQAWKAHQEFIPDPEILEKLHDLKDWEINYKAALH